MEPELVAHTYIMTGLKWTGPGPEFMKLVIDKDMRKVVNDMNISAHGARCVQNPEIDETEDGYGFVGHMPGAMYRAVLDMRFNVPNLSFEITGHGKEFGEKVAW